MNLKDKIANETVPGKIRETSVVYLVEVVDAYNGDTAGTITVTGVKDELVDFETAESEEAIEPIFEALEEELGEDMDIDSIEVAFIFTTLEYEDGSSLDIIFLPDGEVHTTSYTVEENIELLLQYVLQGKNE